MANYLSDYTGEQIDDLIKIIGDVSSSAASHNGMYRGIDLSTKYTVEQIYEKVHTGDFSDLYLGDYIPVSLNTNLYKKFTGTTFESGVTYYERTGTHPNWTYTATLDSEYDNQKTYYTLTVVEENVDMMIADFDYFINVGDSSPVNYHHIILIPKIRMKKVSYINPTNTSDGAYYNSEIHQTILPCYAASLSTALNAHIKTYRDALSDTMTATTPSMGGSNLLGASTGRNWYNTNIRLMSETMVYGCNIWSSSGWDSGCGNRKLAVFNFISPIQFGNAYCWLSSVVSDTHFAFVNGTGNAAYNQAGQTVHVRPLIVFG